MAPAVATQTRLKRPQVDQVPRERHDDFGRERDAGGFDAHECGNAGVSAHVDDVRDELDKDSKNSFGHGADSSI